ncbi:response regulator transcription factor [Paenibacillus crassostreae]|uniref:XRE family transcriptional regulator n=1 Tax=Paenibacillus crassostreae TaxID=1763538 RepID=A0A162KVN0_9BACL|nr:response regulator transcription factor [Paenibacillus crassostreae]AOZ91178.1 DNA-binding response regulator [Paenibacillus crassostreae]OAB74663.1 XRE family transcriptional regulator [Paenibacillus crassostreae]
MDYSNIKVLVVEDDEDINRLLCRILTDEGITTVSAFSGSEASLRLSLEEYQLVLIDLMLPGIPGETLIAKIREQFTIPIIVISAKSALEDKVMLLRLGADDYITKPFEKEEVLARVEAQLRRLHYVHTSNNSEEIMQVRELIMNKDRHEVTLAGQLLTLTNFEFDILALLLSRSDKIFSKSEIYSNIWQGTYLGDDNTINVHISNLRAKIASLTEEEYIRTIWGIGFKIG